MNSSSGGCGSGRNNVNNTVSVSDNDNLICPVCRCTCFPPVSLYCGHIVCLTCWRGSQESAWSSDKCPLCRRRLSTWVRLQRNNEIKHPRPPLAPPWPVDLILWNKMKDTHNIIRQQQDKDEDYDEETIVVHDISAPGELKKEYEAELERVRRERRLSEEKHLKETEKLIRELREREMLEEEEMRKKIAEDEELARRLAENSQDLAWNTILPEKRMPIRRTKQLNTSFKPIKEKSHRQSDSAVTLDTYFSKNNQDKVSQSVPSNFKNMSISSSNAPSPESLSATNRCGRFLKNFLSTKLWGNSNGVNQTATKVINLKYDCNKINSNIKNKATLLDYNDSSSDDSTIEELCYFKPLKPEPVTRYNVKSLKCQAKRASAKKSSPMTKSKNSDTSSLLQNLELLKGKQLRNAMDVSAFVCLLSVPKSLTKHNTDSVDVLPASLRSPQKSPKNKINGSPPKKSSLTKNSHQKNEVTPKKTTKVKSQSCIKDHSSSAFKNGKFRRSLSFSENNKKLKNTTGDCRLENGFQFSDMKKLNMKSNSVTKLNKQNGNVDVKNSNNINGNNGFSLITRSKRKNGTNLFLDNDSENFSIDKIDPLILEEQKMIEEKIYQEKKDLALAKKLQRQFGGENLMATTGYTVRTAAKRQTTLIELIPSPKKLKK